MAISLLKRQFENVFHCSVVVYCEKRCAKDSDILQEAGFCDADFVEFPVDETQTIREFERFMEDQFNLSLELCSPSDKPIANKYLKLYQLRHLFSSIPDPALDKGNNMLY